VLVELAYFICFILVLIKQFQTAGPIHGIIGIITCTIWTFIWGWMNAARLNIRNIMLIWTALFVLCIILSFFLWRLFVSSIPDSGYAVARSFSRKHESAASSQLAAETVLECADQSAL
jgi:hypothetical protein